MMKILKDKPESRPNKAFFPFSGRWSLWICLFAAFWAVDARADTATFLMLGKLRQHISLNYNFHHQSIETAKETTSRVENRFAERYGMAVPYALLNPRIINGNLTLSVDFRQRFNHENGGSYRLDYAIDGNILEHSRHPASYRFYSQRVRIDRDFSPGYDQINQGYSGGIKLNNDYLPASLNYNHNTTESDGLIEERRHESDTLLLTVSNSLGRLSSTTASYSYSQFRDIQETDPGHHTSSTNFHISNTLTAGRDRIRRFLRSRYLQRVREGEGRLEERLWEEDLTWALGRALEVGGGYKEGYQTNNGRESESRHGSGFLEHRLYESLFTHLSGFVSSTEYDQGYSHDFGSRIGFNYRKKLPVDSRLHIDSHYAYAEIENNLEEQSLFVLDETHAVPELPAREIVLDGRDILSGSIVVRNKDRTVRYRGGLDFIVEQEGRLTRLVFPVSPPPSPEPILPGKVLSIDYEYLDNPDIRYATKTFRTAVNLSLFSGRHGLSAGYSSTAQELLSGQSRVVGLQDTKSYFADYRLTLKTHAAGVGGSYVDSSLSDHWNVSSFYRYFHRNLESRWSLLLKNQYWRHSLKSGAEEKEDWRNAFNAVFDYRKVFARIFTTTLRTNYLWQTGEKERHDLSADADTVFHVGRTEVTVLGRFTWSKINGTKAWSEYFGLQLLRHF